MRRDGKRCVISERLDYNTAVDLVENSKVPIESVGIPICCEAAHIIPHSSNQVGANGELVIKAILPISAYPCLWLFTLSMFAPDLGSRVNGPITDNPYNSILMTKDLHHRFGTLDIWFEATEVSYVLNMT